MPTCSNTACVTQMKAQKLEDFKQNLYPNPSLNGVFQFNLTEYCDDVKILVANLSGQIVKTTSHRKFGEKLTIDLSQCVQGVYIINIIVNGKSIGNFKAIRG